MLIKFFNGREDIEINSEETVMEYVKSGQMDKNTRIFDSEFRAYRRLGEVKEVEDLALIPEHNQYLNMNVQRILNLRKEVKSEKDSLKAAIVTASVFAGIGLLMSVVGGIKLLVSIMGASVEVGIAIGVFLGKQAVYACIWFYLYKRAKEKKSVVPLIVISVIYFVTSLISFFISLI